MIASPPLFYGESQVPLRSKVSSAQLHGSLRSTSLREGGGLF
jgi:hypothetical protein